MIMLHTRHKGYMMLNRDFTIEEIQRNELDAKYYRQINKNTLIFNRNSYHHYNATDEVFRYYYPEYATLNYIDETCILETKNEFIIVMFDYDFDFPPKPPKKVDGVTIWLPYSIEIYSDEQIIFLEELIDTCKDFRYIELKYNTTTRFINKNLSWRDSTSQQIEVLEAIVSLARKEKEKQKIRKKEIL